MTECAKEISSLHSLKVDVIKLFTNNKVIISS